MDKLNSDQKQEVEADVAAFLLVCGLLSEGASRPRIYRAIGGSMVALVALAHVNEAWVSSGANSTHPGVLERYEILAKIIKEITMDLSIGEESKDHPIGFLIQFRGSFRWCCKLFLRVWVPMSVRLVSSVSFRG